MTFKKLFSSILFSAAVLFALPVQAETEPAVPETLLARNNTAATKIEFPVPVCDITGHIQKLENVDSSPWSGTPSRLTTQEVRVHVNIDSRTPHDSKSKPADCAKAAAAEPRLYKLCSNTKIKAGDRIQGTEGTLTGSAKVGCLFDLVVLPPKKT